MNRDSDRLVGRSVELLRRASRDVLNGDARRFFIPRGTSIKIDLDVLLSVLLAGLASGIECRAKKITRGNRLKRR